MADASAGSRYFKLRNDSPDRAIEWWFIKVVEDEGVPVFDAYVGLDRNGRVIERSSAYGVFEGKAREFLTAAGASPVSEENFAAAWRAPRAPLSRRRRLLQWLNGVNDEHDPTA